MKKLLLLPLLFVIVVAKSQSPAIKEIEKSIRAKIFAGDAARRGIEKIKTINFYENGLVAIMTTNPHQQRPDFIDMLKLIKDFLPEGNNRGFYQKDKELIFQVAVDTVTTGKYGTIDYKVDYRIELLDIELSTAEAAKKLEADFIKLYELYRRTGS